MREVGTDIVLIVEDDFLQRMMLAEAVADEGYSVLEASDAETAKGVLRRVQPKVHAVVTDLQMPGGQDGRDLAWNVYQHWPHTRIVVVSGAKNVELASFPPETVYLAKPYEPEAILRVLRSGLPSPPVSAT